jgi:hypothetical protein
MGDDSDVLSSTISTIRKHALWGAIAAFAVMAGLVFGKAMLSGKLEWWGEALFETVKAIAEAIGATLLIGALIDSQIERLKTVQILDKIQAAYKGKSIVDALDRDVSKQKQVIIGVEFRLEVNKNDNVAHGIPSFAVSLTKSEKFVAIEDIDERDDVIRIDQFSGNIHPWHLDKVEIRYKDGEWIDKSPPKVNTESYALRIDSLNRGDVYEIKTIRSRIFVGGIMENHVFVTAALGLKILVDIDATLKTAKKYPINIFVNDNLIGYRETKDKKKDLFSQISKPNGQRMVYELVLDRQFLPYQGFSFFSEQFANSDEAAELISAAE